MTATSFVPVRRAARRFIASKFLADEVSRNVSSVLMIETCTRPYALQVVRDALEHRVEHFGLAFVDPPRSRPRQNQLRACAEAMVDAWEF